MKIAQSRNLQMATRRATRKGRVRDHIRTALFHATRPLVAKLFRIWIGGSKRIGIGPFDLINLSERSAIENHFEKLAQAAELIRIYDQLRYRLLTAEVQLIVVTDRPIEAEYYDFASAVIMQAKMIELLDVQGLAAVLIHEATHARIRRSGIRYAAVAEPRVERLCLRNEIWFLQKVPNTEVLVQIKRERLPPR